MTTIEPTKISTTKWPKKIYAFVWLKKEYILDPNKTMSYSELRKMSKMDKSEKYDMNGKLELTEILNNTPSISQKCEYCSQSEISLSLYSGKLVCNKCALFQERLQD